MHTVQIPMMSSEGKFRGQFNKLMSQSTSTLQHMSVLHLCTIEMLFKVSIESKLTLRLLYLFLQTQKEMF